MHRSRLSTVLLDAPVSAAEATAGFWSAALGAPVRRPPGEPQFFDLHGALPDLVLAVQSVDDEPRYHVDLETDDVAAEVARLVALSAAEVSTWQELSAHLGYDRYWLSVLTEMKKPRGG